MAELALEPTLDLGDYLSAAKRRWPMITLVGGVVFAIGLVTAFVWPPTYQSSSTILIEKQEIPADLVRTTITSYAAQTIQVINQRVMTRGNLLDIIKKYNLFEDDFKRKTTEEILFEMRDAINVEMITADVMDPRTGRPVSATIAFKVGFQGEKPQLVLKVTSELTTLYLNENLKTRTEKTEETYAFLTKEAERLDDEIERLDAALSEFKEKNIDLLPESRQLTEQLRQRAEMEIDDIGNQIRQAEETKVYLRGQLALLDPYSGEEGAGLNPAARLQALKTQYSSLSARYSPDHPDVISLKREISALEQDTGIYSPTEDQRAQLDLLKKELDMAEQIYTAEHPDVKNLKRQIATLEDNIKSARTPSTESTATNPTNPAYITLMAQLKRADIQIALMESKQEKLRQKIDDYESRLLQMPRIEGTYRDLLRDYTGATNQYQEIKAKQRMAEVAQELEKERKGEKFTLIEPAALPEEPISPNRPAIIFLSLVLALGAGVGSAAIAESMNSAVRGAKGLTALLHTAPLAVIPYIENAAESTRHKQRNTIMIVLFIIGIVILLLAVHFLFSPLDVLWFRGVRKVDNLIGG